MKCIIQSEIDGHFDLNGNFIWFSQYIHTFIYLYKKQRCKEITVNVTNTGSYTKNCEE